MSEDRVDPYRLFVLLGKELRDLLRDRRVLFSAVLLPALLIPLLLAFSGLALDLRTDSGEAPRVGVAGDTDGLRPLVRHGREFAWKVPGMHTEVLEGELDVVLERRAEAGVVLYRLSYDGGRADSRRARDMVIGLLDRLFAERRRRTIEARLGPEATGPRLETVDLGGGRAGVQRKLPSLLPMLLVLVLVSAAAFAALDLFPGERERGTLETLLVQPLHRAEILLAKAIAVFLTGYAGVLVNLASLQACAFLGLGGIGDELDVATTGLLAVAALPLAAFLTAALVRLLARTHSVREGQHLLMPLALLCLLPAFLAGMPEVPFRPLSVMVPLLGPSLGIREVLLGNHDYLHLTLALVSGLTCALLLLESALRGFCAGHELLLDEGPTSRPRELGRAWFLVLCSMLLLFTLGPMFQDHGPVVRIALPQLLFVLLPVLLCARWLGIPAWREARYPLDNGAALPCKPWTPSLLRGLAAGPAILLASSALAGLQEGALPMPSAFRQAAAGALDGVPMSLPVLVLLLGLLPALSEELLYRRLFLSRLLLVHTTRRALVLSACCFALHHLSLWRFFPSLVGGLVLGGLVLRTGRLAPAVVAHALSNSLAALVVLPGSPGDGSELATFLLTTDAAPTKLAVAIGLGSLALLGRRRWRIGIPVAAPAMA